MQSEDLMLLEEGGKNTCDLAISGDQRLGETEGLVSFHAELPLGLQMAMRGFIEQYPNWDQYRLIKAALAGFLVQNGIESRSITRMYIENMFRTESFNE